MAFKQAESPKIYTSPDIQKLALNLKTLGLQLFILLMVSINTERTFYHISRPQLNSIDTAKFLESAILRYIHQVSMSQKCNYMAKYTPLKLLILYSKKILSILRHPSVGKFLITKFTCFSYSQIRIKYKFTCFSYCQIRIKYKFTCSILLKPIIYSSLELCVQIKLKSISCVLMKDAGFNSKVLRG